MLMYNVAERHGKRANGQSLFTIIFHGILLRANVLTPNKLLGVWDLAFSA